MKLARFDGIILGFVKFIESLPDDPAILLGTVLLMIFIALVFLYVAAIYWKMFSG